MATAVFPDDPADFFVGVVCDSDIVLAGEAGDFFVSAGMSV